MAEKRPDKVTITEVARLAGVSTAVILAFALMAEIPKAEPHWGAMAALLAAMFVLLAISGLALWRATRFT